VHHDAQEMCCPGYPEDAHSHVLSTQLPAGRTRFLQPDDHWQSLGPFTRAHDLFDDGSAFAVDTPGHCSGCQNLLVRTSPDGGWLFLAGDSAHDRRLLLGAPMALSENVDAQGRQKATMHHDRALAEDTIRRIRELLSVPRVRVIIAHDHEWYAEHKDKAFFPGKIESL
jgi:glyoxylase-like metal-dependent hydrolase (beta-lactamase superfamily II)